MKKFFKTLMMCLVVIPCVFVLAACGAKDPNQVNVNTKGKYSASNIQAFDEAIAAAYDAETLEFNSYRLSYKATIEEGGEKIDVVMHATVMIGEDDAVSMYTYMKTGDGLVEYYLDAEYMYMKVDSEGMSANYKMPADPEALGEAGMALQMGSIESLLDEIAMVPGEIAVEVAEQDTTTKYHLTFATEEEGEAEVWFVFENGTLTGVKSVSNTEGSKGEIQMERFTGTSIALPKWTADSVEMPLG
jgi:hypothetical protein